jgi:hypothetical protein
MGLIVERVRIPGINVCHSRNLVWMTGSDRAEYLACNRMSS